MLAVALTVGFDALSRISGLIRENLLALVAAVFLYVPWWMLRPDRALEDYGLHGRDLGRAVGTGILFAAVTLVGFVPGYHLWATRALHQRAAPAADAYLRLDDDSWGAPTDSRDGLLHVYHLNGLYRLAWTPPDGDWTVAVLSDGMLLRVRANRPGPVRAGDRLGFSGTSGASLDAAFVARGGSALHVEATLDGAPVAPELWAIGGSDRPARARELDAGALRLPLRLRWILLALLSQVLLVALPEELFFRGYLLRRHEEIRGRRVLWRLGPVELTAANLIVSVGFALGHFAIGWDVQRLAVFFPSLVFGYLRDRTDGIAAPVTYHALCNLMVQLVAVHYLPA